MYEWTFWLAIGQVIWIDALLSGDNAVVVALACRNLPNKQRQIGIFAGAAIAAGMRIIFTSGISQLMEIPYLRMIGALALVYVAAKMCIPDDDEPDVTQHSKLIYAIATVVVADFIMSLDNMVAVAAVAQGRLSVLVIGLLISIPFIFVGASLISKVIEKYPALVWAGALLLGWIAGELFISDKVITANGPPAVYGLLGSFLVLNVALTWREYVTVKRN